MGAVKNLLLPKTRTVMNHARVICVPPGKDGGANIPARWDGTNFFWPTRILLIGVGRGRHWSVDGHYSLTMPISGTIVGYAGAPNVTATAAGIPIAPHTALYVILPIGGTQSITTAAQYALVNYTADFVVPENWFLIASYSENVDSGVLKTCWGDSLDFWRTPGFLNGWTQYSDLSYSVRYRLCANGSMVSLRGLMTPGSYSVPAFTLPLGYRPAQQLIFSAVQGDTAVSARISANGDYLPMNNINGSWWSVSTTFNVDN